MKNAAEFKKVNNKDISLEMTLRGAISLSDGDEEAALV